MRPLNLAIAAQATRNAASPATQAIAAMSQSGAGARRTGACTGISRRAAGCGGEVGGTTFLKATAPIQATFTLNALAYCLGFLPSHTTPSISFEVRIGLLGVGALAAAAAAA